MSVYSEDRVGRLRIVLWIVVAIGGLVALLALATLAAGEHPRAGLVATVVAALLFASSGIALRLLHDAKRPAKVAAIVTGALCMVSGAVSGSWIAFLLLLIGLVLLFLALLPDEPGAGP